MCTPRFLHKFITVDASEHSLEIAVFDKAQRTAFVGSGTLVLSELLPWLDEPRRIKKVASHRFRCIPS